MTPTDHDVDRRWRQSAFYWEKHRAILHELFLPITSALVELAELVPRSVVLDVAAGTGEPSLTIAERIGSKGRVVCSDRAHEMVAAAKRAAAGEGLRSLRFCQLSAQALPFASRRFDATVSRFGVMFFPDTVAALREMLRVTKSGHRVALAVWCAPERNPFFSIVTDVLARYLPPAPEPPNSPGGFRFAAAGLLADRFREAGARDVIEPTIDVMLTTSLPPEEFWRLRCELSDAVRERASHLSPEQLSPVVLEVTSAARQMWADGRMRIPAQVRIVAGRSPGR